MTRPLRSVSPKSININSSELMETPISCAKEASSSYLFSGILSPVWILLIMVSSFITHLLRRAKMPISKKNLDRAMRALCNYFENRPKNHSIGPEYLHYHGLPKAVNAQQVAEKLCSMGLITLKKDYPDDILLIELTDDGKCYFERKAEQRRKEMTEWIRYGITTAIAIMALVLAAISLAAELGLIAFPRA